MSFSLEEITPIGNYVLLELQSDAGEKIQQHKSGLYLSFAYQKSEAYAPVFGKVLKIHDGKSQLQIGDTAFFHYLSYSNGLHTKEKWARGVYFPTVHSFEDGDKKYLVIHESDLIFCVRGEELIALNENVLLKSIPLELQEVKSEQATWTAMVSDSTGIISSLHIKGDYRKDIAEIVSAPQDSDLQKGDIVYPDKEWDVNAEYDILSTLPFPIYYISSEYILGKAMP